MMASYVEFREGEYEVERRIAGTLVIAMAITVVYGVLKLRQMQTTYDANCPPRIRSNRSDCQQRHFPASQVARIRHKLIAARK